MNKISHLKFPPIKLNQSKKLPDFLVHGQHFKAPNRDYSIITLFRTKDSGQFSRMTCYKEFIERDCEVNVPSLFIDKIMSFPPRNGLGTKMLDFAQSFSKKLGCNGYFHLYASSFFTPQSVPHIFYRKYGMSTKLPYIDAKMDNFIRKGKTATHKKFNNIEMFYPPIKKFDSMMQFLCNSFFS